MVSFRESRLSSQLETFTLSSRLDSGSSAGDRVSQRRLARPAAHAFAYEGRSDSSDFSALYAGQAAALARELPAGELTLKLAAEAREHA